MTPEDRLKKDYRLLLIVLIAVVLPFAIGPSGYITLGYCKWITILGISALSLIVALVFVIRDGVKCDTSYFIRSSSYVDWIVLLYALSSLASCVTSPNRELSFIGYRTYCGTSVYICGAWLYFLISRGREYHHSKLTEYLITAAWSGLFVWSIINAFGLNLFGLPVSDRKSQIATLGHFNSASAFFCMAVVFLMGRFITVKDNLRLKLIGSVLLLGLISSIILFCDAFWFGFLFALIFIFKYLSYNPLRADRFIIILFSLGLSLSLTHLCLVLDVIQYETGVSHFLASIFFGEFMMFVSGVSFCLVRPQLHQKLFSSIFTICKYLCLCLFLCIILYCAVQCISNPSFGTNRGAIWRGSLWIFSIESPLHKCVGVGSGMFCDNLTLATNFILGRKNPDTFYATGHNLFFEALLSQGLVGLLILSAGIVGVIRDALHSLSSNKTKSFVFILPVLAYFGQSLVTSPYNYTVILVFMFLALYRRYLSL